MAGKRSYLEADSSDVTSDSDPSDADIPQPSTNKSSTLHKGLPPAKITKDGKWNDDDEFQDIFGSGLMSSKSKKLVEKEMMLEEQRKKNDGLKISKKELNPDLARIRDLDEDKHEKELMDFYEKQIIKDSKGNRMSTMQKLHRKTSTCPFCPESERFMTERGPEILSMSASLEGVYMSYMGSRSSIHKYHFRIVPMSHKPSMVALEDNTYEILKAQKKRIIDFLSLRNLIPVFVEIASSLPSMELLSLGGGHHCNIEVFSIPKGMVDEAKMAFRVALESTGAEWSQHKKVLDTVGRPDAPRGMIPMNIPYMHVSFSLDGGYAHVLEVGDDDIIDNQAGSIYQFRQVVLSIYGENMLYRHYRNKKEWSQGLSDVRDEMLRWGGDTDVLAQEKKEVNIEESDKKNETGK